jgi:hypothetical protein
MNQKSEFPFERARRVTSQEHQEFRAALVQQFGIDLKKRVHHKDRGLNNLSLRCWQLQILFNPLS